MARTPPSSTAFDRILDVDALRGFALFGILLVNIWYFASGYAFPRIPDPAYPSWLDHGIRDSVALLFEMKFYLLFSFLFGYSFTLQIDAARRRDTAFRPRFLRRLAGLFVLGGLHAVLLFHGDILTTYAVLGLVLLAVHRIRPRTAVILTGLLVGVVVFFFGSMRTVSTSSTVPRPTRPASSAPAGAPTGSISAATAGRVM